MNEIRPGYKSSEFWITIAAMIGGVVLIAFGHEQAGMILLAPIATYPLARGIAKKGNS